MSRTIPKRTVIFATCTALVMACCSVGAVLAERPTPHACRPPADQDSYIAALLADPVMQPQTYAPTAPTSPSTTPTGPPYVRRYCDLVGFHVHGPGRSIDVFREFTAADRRDWYPLPFLYDRLQPTLTRLGWTYAGYTDDDSIAGVQFCKKILDEASLVDIDVNGPRRDLITRADLAGPATLRVRIGRTRDGARCPEPPTAGGRVDRSTRPPSADASDGGSTNHDQGPARRRWTFNVDGPLGSTPGAHDGVIYLATGRWSTDNHVYALDAATGTQRWRTRIPGAVDGRMAVDHGQVYLGSSLGLVLALDAATGAERWRSLIPYARKNWPSGSALDAGDGAVYVAALDGRVYALEQATGAVRWRSAPSFIPFETYGQSSPVFAGTVVSVVGGDRTLYALDSRTGATRWHTTAGGGVSGPVSAIASTLYVQGAYRRLYALDAEDGTVRWATPSGSVVVDAPSVPGGLLTTGNLALARAVDRATGAVRWQTSGWPVTAGRPSAGLVFVTDEGSALYALDAATGNPVWLVYLRQYAHGLPIVQAGVVCLGADHGSGGSGGLSAGTLYAFDASPGG